MLRAYAMKWLGTKDSLNQVVEHGECLCEMLLAARLGLYAVLENEANLFRYESHLPASGVPAMLWRATATGKKLEELAEFRFLNGR